MDEVELRAQAAALEHKVEAWINENLVGLRASVVRDMADTYIKDQADRAGFKIVNTNWFEHQPMGQDKVVLSAQIDMRPKEEPIEFNIRLEPTKPDPRNY